MNPKSHRCCQCSHPFVPNPRVGDRQVTCGRPKCQRAQHADACRRWRGRNRDVSAKHYEEVVIAFRERHPGYQRRWRLLGTVGEIRDEIWRVVSSLLGRLRTVAERGHTLKLEAGSEQTHVRSMIEKNVFAASGVAAQMVVRLSEVVQLVNDFECGMPASR
jgi:hypothetical protein